MQYKKTGKFDKKGLEIFAGHIIRTNFMNQTAVVIWLHDKEGFYLDFGRKFDEENRFQKLGSKFCEPENCEIEGHVNLTEKSVCGGVA